MDKNNQKSILEYWRSYLKTASPLIKDWLDKENFYLQKNIKKNSVVLDVGCGLGRSMSIIADTAKQVIGIDNNKMLIKKAQVKIPGSKNAKIFFGDAKEIHFKDDTFDCTICTGNTFGDFGKDKLKILKEMKRVTKRGGKIIISVYSENALNTRLEGYEKIGIKTDRIENGTVYTKEGLILEQFSREQIKKILSLANLKVKVTKLNPISYICEVTVEK